MPIIKSAKKRMKQEKHRRARNFAMRRKLRDVVKDFLTFVKGGQTKEATEMLPQVFSVVDTAVKKRILHKNNAARRKSSYAKMIATEAK